MKTPFIIADIWGMPPIGLIASAVIVLGFAWTAFLQIKAMLPEIRRYPYTWPQIIRGFFIGCGQRFHWVLYHLFWRAYRLGGSLFAGVFVAVGLIGYLRVNRYIAFGAGAVVALIIWLSFYGSGGGGGGGYERGRRFPTRRDG